MTFSGRHFNVFVGVVLVWFSSVKDVDLIESNLKLVSIFIYY